jgi:hypothetical protein
MDFKGIEAEDLGICPCGRRIYGNRKLFAVIHEAPICDQFRKLEPDEFLKYVRRFRGITDS